MKKTHFLSRAILVTCIALVTIGSSCSKDDDNDNNNGMYTISGNASGSQMAPSLTGNGTGTITGTYAPQ